MVWTQCRRLFPDHSDAGYHVLFSAKSGGSPGLFLPPFDHPFLVIGIHLHLGGTTSLAQYSSAQVAPDVGNVLQLDALGAEMGDLQEKIGEEFVPVLKSWVFWSEKILSVAEKITGSTDNVVFVFELLTDMGDEVLDRTVKTIEDKFTSLLNGEISDLFIHRK